MEALKNISELTKHSEERRQVFILTDTDLRTVYISEEAERAVKNLSVGTSFSAHLTSADSFRLESFAKSREKYEGISSMEVSLSHSCGFGFAYVCRRSVFTSPYLQIYLYPSRREFLLTEGEGGAYSERRHSTAYLMDTMSTLRSEAVRLGGKEESAAITSPANILYGELIREALIRTVKDEDRTYPLFDLCAAVELAFQTVATDGCVLDFSPSLLSQRCSRIRMTAENLISLVCSAFFLVSSVSDDKAAYIFADLSPTGEFHFSVAAKSSVMEKALPENAGLIELDSILRSQSFRIFICDLICTQSQSFVRAETVGGDFVLRFTVMPAADTGEFKSRDTLDIAPLHMKLCCDALSSELI